MSALLLVETSATMRHVLSEHLRALGYVVHDVASHREAIELLDARLRRFDTDYDGIVFGWPAVADADADALAERLERDDVTDLPVAVMSTDMRSETRAWVAARAHTAMVAWKRYRDVESVLDRLIDPGQSAASIASKFDNQDIRLLIVDDSATIRRSLRDLFSQQGYNTVLAASADAALDIARDDSIDIAIVDFYLGEDTGDRVCRELVSDPATGEIVCAVLTGTYSDQIIRRSLRAGALECLFKNESSELLLNRVDALSRFVRQSRRLADQRQLLDRVVDAIAGAALVLDNDHSIRHVSEEALALLGHDDAEALIGHPLTVVTADGSAVNAQSSDRLAFRCADGAYIDVAARYRSLGGDVGTVLQFSIFDVPAENDQSAAVTQEVDPAPAAAASYRDLPAVRTRVEIPMQAAPFLSLLSRVVTGEESVSQQASLLVLRLWLRLDDGSIQALGDHQGLESHATPKVLALYRRKDHVVALGDGRYGFLIRHVDGPQSWVVTRKLMQLANESLVDSSGQRLACTASIKRVDNEMANGEQCMAQMLDALDYVDARSVDKALLMDPRRMLAVYPEPSSD